MKQRLLTITFAVMTALVLTTSASAQDGAAGAFARADRAPTWNAGAPFASPLAAADFDGDHKPDGALLVDAPLRLSGVGLRTIELHFTGRTNTVLQFESGESGLSVTALDVNHDGATDIVVEQGLTHKRLKIWLNDGQGNFHEGRLDDPSQGLGDGEQLESQSQREVCIAFCLSGTQTGQPTAYSQVRRIVALNNPKAVAIEVPLLSGVFSSCSPRAPPQSRLF